MMELPNKIFFGGCCIMSDEKNVKRGPTEFSSYAPKNKSATLKQAENKLGPKKDK